MYTIKQAALRAGVSTPVLRAWERRYRIVEPARTAAGYRLYDDAAVDRVRTMRRLVDDGWSPSTAASTILAATARGEPMPEPSPTSAAIAGVLEAGGSAPPATEPSPGSLARRFVEAAGALDQAALEAALDEMFALGSFERVAEQTVLPALRALGDAWQAGAVGVAAEHEASNAVYRRLAAAYEAAARDSSGPTVLVGLPPLARHELGALAFAVAARRAGLNSIYLGADLPVNDWVSAAVHSGARAVVLGVTMAADVEPAMRVAEAIQTGAPGVLVAFGGPSAPPGPATGPWLRLPDGLIPSVEALRQALDR